MGGLRLTAPSLQPSISRVFSPLLKYFMEQVRSAIQEDFERLNQSVVESLYTDVDLVENIGQYIIDAGGKRIRPVITLLFSKAFNCKNDNHVLLATIIEYIHTATLLHDDVVDLSTMRRGRPTANAQWGNAPSVLVGDFIYSRAFQLLVKLGRMDIMALMSETTNRIAAGEVLQLARAGSSSTSQADYFDIIERKTAILFAAACQAAAILTGQSQLRQTACHEYGHNLGMAFQLIDDYLDYTGDATVMGKNVGDDLAEGKSTLPLILAMQQSSPEDAAIIAHALEQKALDQIEQVVAIVQRTSALDDTKALALDYANKAQQCLSQLDESIYKQQLIRVADLAVQRVA